MPKEKKKGKEEEGEVRFVYGEAAVVVNTEGKNRLVIGDVHIGAEQRFVGKGVHLYNIVDAMVEKIKRMMKEHSADCIIILGDVKDSILYPPMPETGEIKRFFEGLKDYDITVTAGNHDPHLDEVIGVGVRIVDELILGRSAFLHGHRWPSDAAMKCNYIFAGHNHSAVRIMDRNKGVYAEKAWLLAKLDKLGAKGRYPEANPGIRLVVLPAFNDLITGMPVNEVKDNEHLSPLFRNKIFDYGKAEVFSLRGERLGTPDSLAQND